jgi:hypothetical protein
LTAKGPSTRVVLTGPAVLNAYASSSGQTLFYARAVHGTDQDCQAQIASGAPARAVRAVGDYGRITLTVNAGEVLCMTTAHHRTEELLWRAHVLPQPPHVTASLRAP